MDFLRRIGRFIGGAAQGVGRAFQQAPQVVSRAVLDAERARQQAIAQVQRNLPRFQAPPPPRIQLPQIQIPRVQLPQVRLPQAPRVDLGAVSRALQAPSQAVQQTTRNVLGQAGRTLGDLQRQSDAIRQRQIQQTQADIARFRTSPATAIFQMPALSPFGGISQAFKGAKVGTGRELPKFDTTKAVEDVSKQLAKTPLRKIPGMGVVGDVVKPLALSAARMADVAQTQEEYAQGIKGIGQMGSDIANIGSLFYAGGLSKQLATKGTAFLPTAARLAPRLAASGAGQNILLQLSEGKKLNELDPKQIAAAAAVYTGLGVGIPGVGRAVGKGVRGIKARLPEVEFVRTPRPGQVAPTPAVRPQRIAQEVPASAMQPKVPKGKEIDKTGITTKLNIYDAYKGESYGTIIATRNGKPVGKMDISITDNGDIYVNNVNVPKQFRRQGIATELYKKAQQESRSGFVQPTLQTKLGAATRKSLESKGIIKSRPVVKVEKPIPFTQDEWARVLSMPDSPAKKQMINKMNAYDSEALYWKGDKTLTKPTIPQVGKTPPTLPIKPIYETAPKAPKGQEALFAEARKYKSADEFVKAQGSTLYHGTKAKNKFDVFNLKKAGTGVGSNAFDQGNQIYLTGNKKAAEFFSILAEENNMLRKGKLPAGKVTGEVLEFNIDKTAKVKLINNMPRGGKTKEINEIIVQAKKEGYDAIRFKDEGFKTIEGNKKVFDIIQESGLPETTIILNPNKIKTKSQLQNIWNKANKPTLPESKFAPGTIGNIYETVPESAMRPKGEASLADIQISTKPIKPKQPVSNKALEVKSQFLNRFDPIERFVRNVELERGTKLKPSENPMYYVKQFMGGGGIANYRIDNELTPMLKQTKNFDGLRQYLVARRMNELASRGIGKKANTAIAELTQKYGPDEIANFDKISTQLYAYQRNQLDQLLATGVISKQSYDNIIAKNQFYIPFNRVIPDVIADTTQSGQKISGAKKLASLKAIKGSEKDIIDPIESVIKNTYDVQATVAKQKVLNSLVALSPDEFKPLPKGAGLKAPAIELFSDGKRVKLAADPELSRALNAMDEEQLNLVVRALSLPARALRAGATSLNVAFALPNVLRDQLSAAVNNKYGGIPMYDFVSGLASVMKKDDSYKKWILSGADQATLFAQDRTTLQRGVKDITGGIGYKAGKLVKSPLELFRIFGDLSEKGSRVGVFKRALKGATKEGLNTEDALLTAMRESREATIDFAQRGSKMKSFNAMVPFLNARVQGTYKLAQSFKNRPIQTMARGAAIASVPAAILYIHNNAEGNADIYKEIPDYIKRENFVIVTGDEKTPFIKIPKGEVGKIFANPVESFLAQIKRDSTNWGDTAKDIVDSFLPVGSVSEPARFITDIGPTAVTVPYQMLSNYDVFRGRNIVGQYQKDLPAAQQFSKYNTETAKKIGELLNISPAQLEFALSGFTGGLGRQGLQVADIAQGQRPPVQELPVLSRFLGEEKDLSATAQKVYEQAEKAKREKARENFRIKQALEKGDTSVLQGVDKTTATRLKRSVAEDQAKKDMSPIQKALFDLPADQLENIKQSGQYKDDIAVVEGIKDSIAEGLKAPKQAKTPKVKVSKARRGRRATGRRRTGRGRVAKVKVPRIKTPRVTVRGLPRVPTVKAKKVSFKVPKPKAGPRKTVKIKQG